MGVPQVPWKATVLHFQNPARIVVTIGYFQSFAMVKEWDVPQRTFLVEKKLGGADLAQIQAEYAHRYFATSFSFSCLTLYQVARTHRKHHQCPSTCFKEILKQAKKFLNCLSQDQIYHPMPSTLAELLCWRCGGRSLQQQAGRGRQISAQNEGKGSG